MYIRRPCGCRCVQYSILGGKAQGVRAIFLRQWIFSFFGGAGQSDPAPGGGLPLAELVDLAAAVPGGVACLLCRPLPLPLACFVAPIPPAPFPSGEGGDSKIILPGATAPGTPALNRLRHLQSLPCWCPEASLAGNRFLSVLRRTMGSATGMQGAKPLASPALDRLRHLQSLLSRCPAGGCSPCGTCSPCPGGEDHLKRRRRLRRIVPSPPVPPLLGCRHCPEDRISVGFASNWRRRRLTPRSNTGLAGRASAARVQPRECKGRSPLHENNLSPPLPAGKGVGGMGATKTTNGRDSRRQRRQATPADTTAARSTGDQPGKPPHRIQQRQVEPATKKHPPHPQRNPFHS